MDESATAQAGPSSSSSNSNNNNNNEPPRKKRKPPPKKPKKCERYYDDYPEFDRPVWKRSDWDLKKRHNTSLQASTSDVTQIGEGQWIVESFTSRQEYTLTEEEDCEYEDQCEYYCHYCETCVHKYSCTCPDFEKGYMCKHIHLLCRFLAESDSDDNDDDDSDQDDDDDDDEDYLRATVDKEWSKIRQLLIDQEGVNIIKRGLDGIREELNQHSSAKFDALRKKREEKKGKRKTK